MRDADVVVVGAGTGGLTTAAYLAAIGRRVVVVDRQRQAGGCGTVFVHDDYEFDVGLHYLGGDGSGPAVRSALEPLGIDISFREQDPSGFDTLTFDDMVFAVPKGIEAFRARLHDAFPDEQRGIDRYLRVIASLGGPMQDASHEQPTGLAAQLRLAWRMRPALARSRTTLGDFFDHLGLSPRLRSVLDWLHGTYGVAPGEASLVLHALITMHYLAGAWYPEGGGQVISDRLAAFIREHGGDFVLGAQVERIDVERGAVRGVHLSESGGSSAEVRAPVVVAAMDLKHAFLDLLPAEAVPARLRNRVSAYEMALPLHVLYLIADRDLRAEGVPNTNYAVVGTDDLDGYYGACRSGRMPDENMVWITSPSLKDPGNPRLCRPGQTNLQVMSIVPPDHGFWDIGPGLVPGPGYGDRKRELADRLLAAAEIAIPGLRASLVHEEAATPFTLEHYLGASGGTSYGIAATPRQFLLGRPGPTTPIRGLFLAGASTRTGHGITGTMLGGLATAGAIAGAPVRRLAEDRLGTSGGDRDRASAPRVRGANDPLRL